MKKQVSLTALALATAMTATAAQAEDVKISGKVFFDYSTDTATGKADKSGSNVTRTYLTAKKDLNDTWSTKVTFDSAFDKKAMAGPTTDKSNNVFLKTAQLTGSFSKEVNIKLGLIGTPWIGYEDKLNGHRYVAKSYVDTHGLDSSADAGMGVFGKIADGLVSYDIVSINGGGYGNTTITEKTDLNARVGIAPVKGLTVDLGYRSGYLGKYAAGTAENKNTLTQTLVTYGNKMDNLSYRVGLNLISNKIEDGIANTSATNKATEFWFWVRSGDFGGYVRNEVTKLDGGTDNESRTVVSADYHADKNVVLSLVSDKSTNVGGTANNEKATTGLFTQFKF